MNEKPLVKFGKWGIKIKFVSPFQKSNHWCYRFLLNIILFTVNITDLYGIIVICNIEIRWDKYFKSNSCLAGGDKLKHSIETVIKIRKFK